MRHLLTALGSVSVVVAIAACSGGAGTPPNAQGPDGPPNSTIDSPGNGYEPPGGGQENPGTGNQDSPNGSGSSGGASNASNCITCSGAFSCVTTGLENDKPSVISLAQGSGGCDIVSDNTDTKVTALLQCGGGFVETQDGATIFSGSWTGSNSGFTVTAVAQGNTLTVSCTPTTQVSGGGGGTTDNDAG
ncbi:MAG: hypothetical protein ABI461_07580 [Polyangiaceae bacterium]